MSCKCFTDFQLLPLAAVNLELFDILVPVWTILKYWSLKECSVIVVVVVPLVVVLVVVVVVVVVVVCWPCAPCAGSGIARIDPLCFLAGCRKRQLNQALSYMYFIVLLFIRAPFYVLLVFVGMCSVFWLFWLSCHYLPSDWLERLL